MLVVERELVLGAQRVMDMGQEVVECRRTGRQEAWEGEAGASVKGLAGLALEGDLLIAR